MTEKRTSLADCVEKALGRYFVELKGEPPSGLYALVLREIERPLLKQVMHHAGSNQSRAARYLGINRNTLRSKLKRHGLE